VKPKVAHAECLSSASPEVVWQLLRDRSTWPSWSPLGSYTLERPGDDGEPNGVGSIALFVTGRHRNREQIVELVPNQRLSYVLVSGDPLRDYRATVELVPEGTGTRIRWRSSFHPVYPGTGWIYRLALTRFFRGMVTGLARAAEQRSEPPAAS